jgi:hypothetical protein
MQPNLCRTRPHAQICIKKQDIDLEPQYLTLSSSLLRLSFSLYYLHYLRQYFACLHNKTKPIIFKRLLLIIQYLLRIPISHHEKR